MTLPFSTYYYFMCNEMFSPFLSTDGFAAAIPRLDLFIALSGATTTAALALIIPCTLDLLVKYPNIPTWAWTKNLAMIAFGIFGSVLGTVLSVEDLIPK